MNFLRNLVRSASLALAFAAVPLAAQVEPELLTKTDLLDVYVKNSGKPQMVTVMDFSPTSRAVFEPGKKYLTDPTRDHWIGLIKGLASVTPGKDFGFVMVLKNGTNEVYLSGFPNTRTLFDQGAGPVVGVPYDFRHSWTGTVVPADADPINVIRRTTHVRFTIRTTAGVDRTVDLPCPWRIFNSPYAEPGLPSQTNYSKRTTGSIVYDPWSEANPTFANWPYATKYEDSHGKAVFPPGTTPIGNFYYTYDYFSWIFGGKQVRNPIAAPTVFTKTPWVPAPTTGVPYAAPSGFAVPGVTETVPVPANGNRVAEGWANGLPVMTRYQATKYVSIEVLLDPLAANLNWVYRFLDSYVDNPTASEEGGPQTTAFTPNPDQSSIWDDTDVKNRKYLRKLTRGNSDGIATNDTSLQKFGPSGWFQDTFKIKAGAPVYEPMDLYDFGNRANVDPRSPQAWAYSMAHTYYRTGIERNKTLFDSDDAKCPGRTYVVIFPTAGLTDSVNPTTNNIPQDAAAKYLTYTAQGNSSLTFGDIGRLPAVTGLDPGVEGKDASFHPGALSANAAYGDSTNNGGDWKAAWESNPTKPRGPENKGIQTMVVSLGIPGSYKFKAGNNGRNPEEAYFRVAQWADPYRDDQAYGHWRASNGAPKVDDYSVVDVDNSDPAIPGKVRYYPSADPQELVQNFKDLAAYIVAGSAALSAPATPSTGARTTTQAYFGIFKTARVPVWGGNLFSVGILRKLDPVTNQEKLSFYGASGEDTLGCIEVQDPAFPTDPTKTITVCGINDFDTHHLWSAFDLFAPYNPADYPVEKPPVPGNALATLKWDARTLFTLDDSNARTDFSASNGTLVSDLVTRFKTEGLFDASVTDLTLEVENFISYIRGRREKLESGAWIPDPAFNRANLMGDIINSAPLAIELSKDLAPAGVPWPGGDDPHVRLILVGSNMGMLHCFAESAYTSGEFVKAKAKELWAFVPPDTLSTLYQIYVNRHKEDSFTHRYLVDGDPALFHVDETGGGPVGDTRVSKGEDAIMVFGMRKGGRSYYAFGLSLKDNASATPAQPLFLWKIDPNASSDPVIQTMGMSTAVPAFAFISKDNTAANRQPVCFIGGGYANAEVNARYRVRATPPITGSQGMGQLILAVNPYGKNVSAPGTLEVLKTWDFKDDLTMGAIGGGVTPVSIFRASNLSQRIYWADMAGNVAAINNGDNSGAASGFRRDSANMTDWITKPRFIYRNSAFRFTNRPDAFRLTANYPLAVDASGVSVKPVTVMVSIGSGDRNNPADRDETIDIGTSTLDSYPPEKERMFVFADRQDSDGIGDSRDANGIPEAKLQEITDDTSGSTNWVRSYSSPELTIGDAKYLWGDPKTDASGKSWTSGYYYSLLDGKLPTAYKGVTHDKLVVSPLVKEGALFFSIFDIQGATGNDCSANAFTRTFRMCDIMRPLAIKTQAKLDKTVGNVDDLNRTKDDCSGLVFYFNSLSSQLADAGDRVVQGGAVSAAPKSFEQQTGANTPDIKEVKSTSAKRGFRLRAWRVVR